MAKNFQLLDDLKNDLGNKYIHDKKIQDLMKKRNNSILAHGTVPINEEIANDMYNHVVKYAKKYIGGEKFNNLKKDGKFPILE